MSSLVNRIYGKGLVLFEPGRGGGCFMLLNRSCTTKTSLKPKCFTEFNNIIIFNNILYDPVILLSSVKNEFNVKLIKHC